MSFSKTNRAICWRFLIAALILWGIFAPQQTARSFYQQQTGSMPDMHIALAWEGQIRTPGWTEIQVTLNNEANNWTGDIIITDAPNKIHYRKSLVLPAHSRKHYRIPLFIKQEFNIQVQLRETENTNQQTQQLTLSPTHDVRNCVLADTHGNITQHLWNSCDTLLLLNNLDKLPETTMVWDTVDVLMINGISTTDLNAAQKRALLAWVSAGGHLILSGGAALPQTLTNLPQNLKIAEPGEVQVVKELADQLGGNGELSAISLLPHPLATVKLSTINKHYAVNQVIGQGKVDMLGWDIVHAQSFAWTESLWAADTAPAVRIPLQQATAISNSTPNIYTLLQVPYTSIPSQWQWLLLFPLYFLLVGPGTWLIVRHLQRPILAWVLIPTWIVLALLILALGLSGTFSRAFPLIHEGAIIYVPDPEMPARAVQGTVIYAPRAQKLTWMAKGASRPLAGGFLMDNWYGEGEPYPLEVHYLDESNQHRTSKPLGIITWGSEGLYTPPQLNTDLFINVQAGIPMVYGTLHSTEKLKNITLLMDKEQYHISLTNVLMPEKNIQISQALTRTYQGFGGPANSICQRNLEYATYGTVRGPMPSLPPAPNKQPSLSSVQKSPCFITGVIENVPFPAEQVGGTHLAESCVIYTIPCPVQSTGIFQIPLNIDAAHIENGWMDEQNAVYLSSSESTIPYVLPGFLNLGKINTLQLKILPPSWSDPDSYIPESDIAQIFLMDWKTHTWVEQPLPAPEEPLELSNSDAERFFDQNQGVHLRVIPQRQDGVYIHAIMTIEGIW